MYDPKAAKVSCQALDQGSTFQCVSSTRYIHNKFEGVLRISES